MYKLTIYQNKNFQDVSIEQEVSFCSEKITEIFDLIECMSKTNKTADTRYEIREVNDNGNS